MKNFDVVRQAWWLHRRKPDHLESVSLPAEKIARILGRECRHPNRVYMAHGEEGRLPNHIRCGLETVWKTGGVEVCAHVLAVTTEAELGRLDYVEEVMWRSHVLNQRAAGYEVPRYHAPTVWRNRRKLEPDEHQALMDTLEAKHGAFAGSMAGKLEDWR